jgi:hypothetical protein
MMSVLRFAEALAEERERAASNPKLEIPNPKENPSNNGGERRGDQLVLTAFTQMLRMTLGSWELELGSCRCPSTP